MRARAHLAAAGLALGPCALAGLEASGCNALSGIDNLVVESVASDASRDSAIARDGAGGDGNPAHGKGDANADAISQASDAGKDADLDAKADAMLGKDATNDATDRDGGCLVVHSNGIGQSFEDCAPLGTRNLTEATAACVAYTGNAAQCINNPPGCTTGSVCSSGAAMCACWRYVGPAGGHVSPPAATCGCASGSSPAWD